MVHSLVMDTFIGSDGETSSLEPKTPVVISEIIMPSKSPASYYAVTRSVAIERGVLAEP